MNETSTGPISRPTVAELISLKGRGAVVTGAGRGLGRVMAERLLDAGASVLIADVNGDLVDDAVSELAKVFDGRVFGLTGDVTSSASVEDMAKLAASRFGSLDVWVNNAGIMPTTGAFADADEDLEEFIVRVNLHGTIRATRAAAAQMTGGGVIINLSSSSAFRAGLGVAAYASSKAAVAALTRNLAVELGRRGIRVLAVAPHIVDTPGTRQETEALAAAGSSLEKLARANPLRLLIEPDHIARVVLFAASDLSAGMSGSTLFVDAGVLA